MFDGPESFAFGYRDVRNGDIVLEVDKRLCTAFRNLPERTHVTVLHAGADGCGLIGNPTGTKRCVTNRPPSVADRFRQGPVACSGSGDRHAFRKIAWQEGDFFLRPGRLRSEMVGEANVRIPSAGNGK